MKLITNESFLLSLSLHIPRCVQNIFESGFAEVCSNSH